MATIIEKVKIALRISHNYLDEDIADAIKACKLDMVRAGVLSSAVDSEDELIERIIKTYCLYVFAPDSNTAERFFESYQYQLDNARKSTEYGGVADV